MIGVFLARLALAEEMAFDCTPLVSAADAYPYVDAVPGNVVNAAIDELLAYVDASCAVATCTRDDLCEEVDAGIRAVRVRSFRVHVGEAVLLPGDLRR